ncbi:hypothetical protein HG535_0C03520 [Zygotorulaspora mrakii]|uniref:Uncharacterized protein n=1 Tax=Zygotorulaspora mrakii TaxID=42260 RepID=A0A7H9B1Z0_ZYGMR|nr:uncharacterized protein HG535_0C03520 [Zygotorulaspora mrakii]QLG71999.1 hypothetical protein HG535_0C03520 [Zygotorulaspora mrakii]
MNYIPLLLSEIFHIRSEELIETGDSEQKEDNEKWGKMTDVEDNELAELLHTNVKELKNCFDLCNSVSIPPGDKVVLVKLQKQISSTIEKINDILQPRVTMKVSALLNKSDNPKPKFSRKRFYSRASPYNNKMDKSNSFRIIPPLTSKTELLSSSRRKHTVASQLLLNNIQLLENLSNLERLCGRKSEV